jgi:hypothetical protein
VTGHEDAAVLIGQARAQRLRLDPYAASR